MKIVCAVFILLVSTSDTAPGEILHEFYYPNGNVYYTGFYSDDLKSGIWEYFTEEGIQDTIINYNE